MAPRDVSIHHDDDLVPDPEETKALPEADVEFKPEWVPRNIVMMAGLHLAGLYGLYLAFTSASWTTIIFSVLLYIAGGLGVTAGAHRLWAHRSYSAKWPLRLILCFFNCIAFQNHIYEWSRDHRVHHKFSETEADPHNANRGFFFSHVGWLLQKKHPLVLQKGKTVDYSDLMRDPIVRFQRKYYLLLVLLCCFVMPTYVPYKFWGESLWNAYFICAIFRLCWTWNMTWLVNSAAHMWGRRPYDKYIGPVENKGVSLGAIGEGFHNYHHTFPWDYAASELGYDINLTKIFIDTMARIGWAYNLKSVSKEVIRARKLRTGDIKEKGPYGPN